MKKKVYLFGFLMALMLTTLTILFAGAQTAYAADTTIYNEVIDAYPNNGDGRHYNQNVSAKINGNAYSSSNLTLTVSYSESSVNNPGFMTGPYIEGHTVAYVYRDGTLIETKELCQIDINIYGNYVVNGNWKCPYSCGVTGGTNTGSSGSITFYPLLSLSQISLKLGF